MSDSENYQELEWRLLELLKPHLDALPSSVQRLLHILDSLSFCLSEVDNQNYSSWCALYELMKALVDERLLKDSNVDVKVAVASCIAEIMRLLPPVVPHYDDDKMMEALQLIVSSFEHLADQSSLSYTRRTSILKTMSRRNTCVLLLELNCDALLVEMFQHFLKSLRDHHPVKVFLDMEDIMTFVFRESDYIPPELLSTILQYVKKDDDEVPLISRRLAERVLINSASKCKTYLAEAVRSSGVPLDKYSYVVASICEAEDLSDQLAKMKHRIVDTLTSVRQIGSELETKEQCIVDTLTSTVRQFRSEIKKNEDILKASLQEVDVLGEKIMEINKSLNS